MVGNHTLELILAFIAIIVIVLVVRAALYGKEDSEFHFEITELETGLCIVTLVVNDENLQHWTFDDRKEAETFIENFY